MLSLGAFYSNVKAKDAMLHDLIERHTREEVHMFRKIAEAGKEDTAEDVFSEISGYLEDFQKNKNLMSLGLEFQIYAIRNPIFKKKFDRSKALNHEELAAGLKRIFARKN
jgi:AcrR family transcriptional regulator